MNNLKLLDIQAQMGLDKHGRIAEQWGIKIAAAHEGQLLFLGSALPQPLANTLQTAFESTPSNPATAPPALAMCERILKDANEPFCCTWGPSYLIPNNTNFTPTTQFVLSNSPQHKTIRQSNPGNWLVNEWNALIDGKLGPWVMATINKRVISICHTPKKMTDAAAECGVWTDPDFRGKGHAAATTAAWASILAPTQRHLFYSTDSKNQSSQRVAARLNLRLIGWTWKLTKPRNSA